LNDTAAAPPVDEGMTTSKAFWKLFRKTMGFEPSAAGAKVEGDGGYARHQAMLSMFRRKYGIRLEEQAEEKMSGDRQDPSRESADARMMMADFDRRLAEADEEYEFTMEAEDTFDWSDEAKTLADLVASDLRLEDRRRPELTTRDFVLGYFKTLRMKDMNIVRIDEDLKHFSALAELSLSGNPLGALRRLPQNLVILNVYNCNVRQLGGAGMALPKLVHLGIGYNEVDNDVLKGFPATFPNLLSLDISYNHLSTFQQSMETLREMPKLTSLMLYGNPCCLVRGYTSKTLAGLPKLLRFDDNIVGADDREFYAEELEKLEQEEWVALEAERAAEAAAAEAETAAAPEGEGDEAEAEEGKDAEGKEEAADPTPPKDAATTLNITISSVKNAPPPKVPKPVLDEESQSSVEEPPAKGKGKGKKGKTPTPSRPMSPEDMTPEDYKALAEDQDMRYFVRVVPPSNAGEHIAYTTRAVPWDVEMAVDDDTKLEMPRTGELVECMTFDGLHLELWQSFPGDKPANTAGEDAEDPAQEEGDELNETEVPRRDILVAYSDVDIKGLLNPKLNGVTNVESTAVWKSLPGGTAKFREECSVGVTIGMNNIPKPIEEGE
jgi:hypothetical protein